MISLDSSFIRFVNQCLGEKFVVFLLCSLGFHFQIPSFPILNADSEYSRIDGTTRSPISVMGNKMVV